MNKNFRKILRNVIKKKKSNVKKIKQRIKDMKKSQKYEEKVGLTPGKLDDKTEKKAKT